MDNVNIAIVILAAGRSTRMGAFKPLLPIGGRPAVVHCVDAAQEAGVRDIIVVTGYMREELERVLKEYAPGARRIHNVHYADGMFSSVRAGVSAVSALPGGVDGFFLLPADCAAASKDTLATLKNEFAKTGGAAVIRPKFEGRRGHPPLIPAAFIGPILKYNGENGLKGFLSGLPTIEKEMQTPETLLDMDTPEDYAAMLKYFGIPPAYYTAP